MEPMLCRNFPCVWSWLYWELASNSEASLLEVVLSGACALLRGWASSWLLLRPWEGLVGLGDWCGAGPHGGGSPAKSNTLSPDSYLTAVSPSRPPVRPRSCRTHHSTVTTTVAWKSRKRHLASHPRAPDLVPWPSPRTTMNAPPLTAA